MSECGLRPPHAVNHAGARRAAGGDDRPEISDREPLDACLIRSKKMATRGILLVASLWVHGFQISWANFRRFCQGAFRKDR
jgi:hypothetical protein